MKRLFVIVCLLLATNTFAQFQKRDGMYANETESDRTHEQNGQSRYYSLAPNLSEDSIAQEFVHPPQSAKPIMIWQWMDGLVTEEGITADLEAYSKAGIGGVQQFMVGGPMQVMVCDTTNAIGTDNWKHLMRHAIKECSRLGLSFGTHNCPGWSSSASKQVKPEYSMQKIVWTDTIINFSKKQKEFQLQKPGIDTLYNYYRDIAWIAFPDDSIIRSENILLFDSLSVRTWMKSIRIEAKHKHKDIWHLYRFGHTTNGKTNYATAPSRGRGLECDKMSKDAVSHFWSTYPAMLTEIVPEENGKTFQRIEIDSYEAGGQEWTRRMPEEFSHRRGYDIIPWLPAITGKTVDGDAESKKVRRDWQETVTDLFAEYYYGFMSQLAHQHGMQLLVQPYGTGRSQPFNPVNTGKVVSHLQLDDPVCAEFWSKPDSWGWKDIPKVVASARNSGKQIIYAEGFTCWPLHAWKDDPAALKQTADKAFCLGINKLMLHASATNPWVNVKPGMTFGYWGTWWTPGQTWWKDGAEPLFSYMARCQSLLQRGVYIEDFQSKKSTITIDNKDIQWIHRKEAETDILFVSNATDSIITATVCMTGSMKKPEIWNPETGQIKDADYWSSEPHNVRVTLKMDGRESTFIVFREKTDQRGPGLRIKEENLVQSIDIDGSWAVAFPEFKSKQFDSLSPWNEQEEKDIKYFSGTATYTKKVDIQKKNDCCRYLLELGDVNNMATVIINGNRCPTLWHKPFKTDITAFIKKGKNKIEIEITNLWVNRLIGDELEDDDIEWSDPIQFGSAKDSPSIGQFMAKVPDWLKNGLPRPSKNRKAVVSFKFFKKDDPLLPSGLLGPVRIVIVEK